MADFSSIALLEFSSIAMGTRASDALAKKAPVEILRAGSLQPGKYAVLFGGDVASVYESHAEGIRIGEDCLIDRVLLPDVEPRVLAAILGKKSHWNHDTVGIIETPTLAAVIAACDAGVKGADVQIVQIRLGDDLGGKGLAYFAGEQGDVEAAVEIGRAAVADRSQSICTTIIPRIDDALRARLTKTTSFAEGA